MGNRITKTLKKCVSCEPQHEELKVDDDTSNENPGSALSSLGGESLQKPITNDNNGDAINSDDGAAALPEERLDPNRYYNMNHKNRGLAMIFNHDIFDSNTPRKGTEIDCERLEYTLKALDFDVRIYHNYTISRIKEVLLKVGQMDHSDNDCLLVAALTHGDLVPLQDRRYKPFNTILTHDLCSYLHATDNKYPLQTVWEQFSDERCPTLKNKPRIFLIAACQGEGRDMGFIPSTPTTSTSYMPLNRSQRDTEPFSRNRSFERVKLDRSKTLPQKDFIVVYSTTSGFYSYRDIYSGTWFIQSLCEVLTQYRNEDLDLLKILTLINQKVALDFQTDDGMGYKQMPCVVSMLSKLLLLKEKKSLPNGNLRK